MASVLISYSHRDSDFIDTLYRRLSAAPPVRSSNLTLQKETQDDAAEMPLESPPTFLDKNKQAIPPATKWLEVIYKAIDDHDTFLFVISPDAVASVVCCQEVKRAVEGHKRIITLLYRPTDPSLLPPGIQEVQCHRS